MIDKPNTKHKIDDGRRVKVLVSDTSPLSLLGTVPGALDWLFKPKCEVWMPDIIMDEVQRDPGEDKDRRIAHRAEISAWIEKNRYRIKRLFTRAGRRYAEEMSRYDQAHALWEMAGRPAGMEPERPDWRDRGDESVWVAVRTANDGLSLGECVLALADDGEVRDAIVVGGRRRRKAAINLMSTQTFIEWMANDFGVTDARTAWQAIAAARENKVATFDDDDADAESKEDPVYIRTP